MKAFNIFAYLALTAAVAAHPADQPANKAILGHPTAVTAQPTPVVNLESDATGAYRSIVSVLKKIASAIGELDTQFSESPDPPPPAQIGKPNVNDFDVDWVVGPPDWIPTEPKVRDKAGITSYRLFPDRESGGYVLDIDSTGSTYGRNYTFTEASGRKLKQYALEPKVYTILYDSEAPNIVHLKDSVETENGV